MEKQKRTEKRKKKPTKLVINDLSWKEAKIAITLIILVFLFASFGVFRHLRKNKQREVSEKDVIRYTSSFIKKSKNNNDVEVTSFVLGHEDMKEARNVLDLFLASSSAKEATTWIREEGSTALLQEAYHPIKEVTLVKNSSALRYEDGSRAVFYFVDTPQGSREIMLFSDPGEDLKVDWRSAYLTGTTPFKKYSQSVPDSIEDLYCYITIDHYYASNLPELDYQSLTLRDYTGDYKVNAYVKRGTYMDDLIGNALLGSSLKLYGKKTIRAVLSLKKIEGAHAPSAEIIDIVATDWITPLMEPER